MPRENYLSVFVLDVFYVFQTAISNKPKQESIVNMALRIRLKRTAWYILTVFYLCSSVVNSLQVISRQEGDIMLGALFPIHAKGSSSDGCGPIQVGFKFLFLVPCNAYAGITEDLTFSQEKL